MNVRLTVLKCWKVHLHSSASERCSTIHLACFDGECGQYYTGLLDWRSDLLLNHPPLTVHTTGLVALWITVTKRVILPLPTCWSFLQQGTLTQSLSWYSREPAGTQMKKVGSKTDPLNERCIVDQFNIDHTAAVRLNRRIKQIIKGVFLWLYDPEAQ